MIALTKDGFQEVHWKDVVKMDVLGLWKDLDTAYEALAEKQDEIIRANSLNPDYDIKGNVLVVKGKEYLCDVYSGGTKELFKQTSEAGVKNNRLLNGRKSSNAKAFVFDNELIAIKYTGTFWFYDGQWIKYS